MVAAAGIDSAYREKTSATDELHRIAVAVLVRARARLKRGRAVQKHGRVVTVRVDGTWASLSDEEAKSKFPNGWKALKPYLRMTPQPNR